MARIDEIFRIYISYPSVGIAVGKLASLRNVQFDVDIEIISRISVVSYEV